MKASIPESKRPLPKGKRIPTTPIAEIRKPSAHEALRQFDDEQIAELALLGLRYRALGAGVMDFSDPTRLCVYWTGTRMAEKAVKEAVKSAKSRSPLAELKSGTAGGYLQALFNCSVISNETYMEQYGVLLALSRGGAK